MNSINGITDKQLRCIQALSKKLSKPLPENLEKMSRKEASLIIEDLFKASGGQSFSGGAALLSELLQHDPDNGKAKVNGEGNGKGKANSSLSREAQIRLGLAAKLVHQNWCRLNWPVLTDRADFKKQVGEMFALLNEVEQEVAR